MRQATGLDAAFLNMETATAYGHVGSLMLFDAASFRGRDVFGAMRGLLEARLHLMPPFRWRLAPVPLGLDHPWWFEDPGFELDFHVRRIAVPQPGDEHLLAELVALLHASPLDRARPLWELYIIEGVDGGLVGQYTKISHALVDGVLGAAALALLLDPVPGGSPVPPPKQPWRPEPVPRALEMLRRGLLGAARQPLRALRLQYRTLRALPRVTRSFANVRAQQERWRGDRLHDALARPLARAPRTPFNRAITGQRRWAFGTLPLADAALVKTAFGVTLNDVVMAACGGALRRWLDERGQLPDAPLLALVPVSLRTEVRRDEFGSRVSATIASLGTHISDPIDRLRHVHEAMKLAKEQHRALPTELLPELAQLAPPGLAALGARIASAARIADRIRPPFNVVISNVPGPRETLYSAGCRLVATYPVSAISDGAGLNMSIASYGPNLDFGFLACRELVPDLWALADHFRDALEELAARARNAIGQ